MISPSATVCFIGFGEAGGTLGADLARRGLAVRAFDILFDDAAERARLLQRCANAGVDPSATLAEALRGAKLVISAVTATAAQDVARAAAAVLQTGQVFLDINSVSPENRRGNAAVVEAAGATYVEAAVMAPVLPQRLRVPMLLGGPRAVEVSAALNSLGFDTTPVAATVGVASAIKMCRSVMIKGMEALAVESLLTARRYGAEDAVLASLDKTWPGMGWNDRLPDYLISRVAEHGRRRAAELREVALTVAATGMAPLLATAIAQRQDALVDAMAAADIRHDAAAEFSWRELADRLS